MTVVITQLNFLIRYFKNINIRNEISNPRICLRRLHLAIATCVNKNNNQKQKNVTITDDFKNMKDKSKNSYLDMIRIFTFRDIHRRGHVEFIYSALKNMETYGVHKDLEVYKALINVLPKGKFIPQNIYQAEFMHYPKQQQCAVDLLEQMEDNGVLPDPEMEQMLLNIFGKRGYPLRKYWRMMYWMPKFRHLSPWPVPNPPPNDAFELALLAIERICSVDLQSKITLYQTVDIAGSIEDTWVVSGQSPIQQKLLEQHKKDEPIYVEGPYKIWLRNMLVNYFILIANPKPILQEQVDPDDVSKISISPFNFTPPKASSVAELISVHEQEDGVILAVCATGTSSKDSLLSWIRHLEKDGNPVLADVPVVFTLKSTGKEVAVKESDTEAYKFQENLLKTMIQIEDTFFELGKTCGRNCLIICDRGAMDASAFISKEKWEKLMKDNNWNNVELRDNRYNQIIHMVSAANGAEEFYTTEDHSCRSEGVELARDLDNNAAEAWIGHPYFDVIDNSTDFEGKMRRMIGSVCQKMAIDTGDRLLQNSRKLKFLVKGPLPPDEVFPRFQDFEVVHTYLHSNSPNQVRLRKRGQKGYFSYIHTVRRQRQPGGQVVEVKTQINHRDYINMLAQKDKSHFTIYKKRRCFLVNNQYFQLDIYEEPSHPRCKGMILLETYTALEATSLGKRLPQFINIQKEVTGNPNYSMYNLSLREDWRTSKKFCGDLSIINDPEDLPTHEMKHNGHQNGIGKCSMVNGHSHVNGLPEKNGIKSNGILTTIPNKV